MFLKRPSVNPTRIPIEREESVRWLEDLNRATGLLVDPARCVHVDDREADIFERFCSAQESGTPRKISRIRSSMSASATEWRRSQPAMSGRFRGQGHTGLAAVKVGGRLSVRTEAFYS